VGAKLYADTATKTLIVTQAPDVNGFVNLNVQEEVWSDLIIDWEGDVDLRKFTFPVVAIGGQTISSGKLGTTYVLLDPWHVQPYEADHVFDIDGNLFTESALTHLVAPTVGAFTVTVNRNLSTLVEVVESGTSGLTSTESQALIDIAADQATIAVDISDIETTLVTLLAGMDLLDEQENAEHITDAVNGLVILRNTDTTRRWEAEAWEDYPPTQRYRGEGLDYVGQLVEVAWS
jgi:hypothetical protein